MPPITEIPTIETKRGPKFWISNIIRKLRNPPAAEYKKVDKFPPSKAVRIKRMETTWKLYLIGNVKMAIIVIRLAIPSFAPGAKTKGEGMKFSMTLIMTACAASMAI